ncbi:MAG: hypothetical protein IPJ65_12590 [Archangiaceae bacterium]|nr:hypothetical protein [Archangiaceae bacterium]
MAQTLRTTRQSAELPAAWLRGATAAAQTHSEADPRGYYDHRVAVHGAAATALLERFAAETGESKPELCAGNELLLVQVHGGDELNANLVAYDVLTGQARELGRLDYETLDAVLGWDGTAAPEALADGVRLPVENGAFDWGDTLVGFESIAEHQLAEPLDFAALVKLGESKQPALAPAAAGLSKAPPQVKDVFSFAVSGDAKSVTATSGATTFTLTASAGATFTGAGWSSDASITQSLAVLASPQLDREAWVEADDALLDSRFGTRDPRPLLWLEQSNGDVSVVAFGASAEQPSMLEIAARPLNVTLHE